MRRRALQARRQTGMTPLQRYRLQTPETELGEWDRWEEADQETTKANGEATDVAEGEKERTKEEASSG